MVMQCGKYHFDFTSNGFFQLVDNKGEPLYEKAQPCFEKLINNCIWMGIWFTLILVLHTQIYFGFLLMGLIFIHLFFVGCRLTTLLIMGGLTPILFPPLWVKLTRKMQKGARLEFLQKYHLQNHPGLLFNLALITLSYDPAQSKIYLKTALFHMPQHPHLLALHQALESY